MHGILFKHISLFKFNASQFAIRFIFFIACGYFPQTLADTNIIEAKQYDVTKNSVYLHDYENQFTVDTLPLLSTDHWLTATSNRLNLGFLDHTIWIKGTINVEMNVTDPWLFSINYPPLDYISIYFYSQGQLIQEVVTGDHLPFSSRPLSSKNYVTRIKLDQYKNIDYLIKIKSSGSLQIPIQISPATTYIKNNQKQNMLISAFYGILFVMGMYNLFIAILVRDRDYYIYVLWVFSSLIFLMSLNGDAFLVFWPNNPEYNRYFIPCLFCVSGFFNTLFALKFMRIEDNRPFLSRCYYILLSLYLFSLLLALTAGYSVAIKTVFLVNGFVLIFTVLTTVYLVFKKQRGALIFLLSFSILLISAIILTLGTAGVFPLTVITRHANQFGMVIESVIFSIALASKIQYERELRAINEKQKVVAEKKAEDNLNLYVDLFENSPISIFRCNYKGEIIAYNSAFSLLFGYKKPEIKPRLDDSKLNIFNDLFPGCEQLAKAVNDIKTNRSTVYLDIQTENISRETIWIALTLVTLNDDELGEYKLEGHAIDITQKKQAEIKNIELEEEKLRMLNQLVTGVAHEINTPVGTNMTALSHMESEIESLNNEFEIGQLTKQDFSKFIGSIKELTTLLSVNEKRTSLLINRFKEVSISEHSYEKWTFDISSMISAYLKETDYKNCSINLDLVNEAMKINSYPRAIKSILNQLISNSIKYTRKQNTIININLSKENDDLVFRYSDNGPGVEKAIADRIFDPFFTSCPGDPNSTGLGMFVIYNICRQLLLADIKLIQGEGFCIEIKIPI